MKFTELNLKSEIIKALSEIGFEDTTTIQEKTIPLVLEKKTDIIAHYCRISRQFFKKNQLPGSITCLFSHFPKCWYFRTLTLFNEPGYSFDCILINTEPVLLNQDESVIVCQCNDVNPIGIVDYIEVVMNVLPGMIAIEIRYAEYPAAENILPAVNNPFFQFFYLYIVWGGRL